MSNPGSVVPPNQGKTAKGAAMNEYVVTANGREKAVTLDVLRAARVLRRCIRKGMTGCSISRRERQHG